MKRPPVVFSIIYLVMMVIIIVCMDIAFWQHHTEIRLIGNISIVAVFLAGYFIITHFISKQQDKEPKA